MENHSVYTKFRDTLFHYKSVLIRDTLRLAEISHLSPYAYNEDTVKRRVNTRVYVEWFD